VRKSTLAAFAAALGLGVGSVPLAARAVPEYPLGLSVALKEKLDAAVTAATSGNHGAPAVSVAIVEDGRIVYERSAGYADLDAKRQVSDQTRFRIASVTKMFTAVTIMQLIESGKLGLDDTLARHLPDAPHASEVTIRQLLTHTSGLPNFLDDAFKDGSVRRPTTPRAVIRSIAKQPLQFAPGTRYSYSNTGYVLLGMTAEAVAGVPLATYEREHIFKPARMDATSVGNSVPDTPSASGYIDAQGTPAPPYDASWLFADGDGLSTAADLARFDIALMNGVLVRPQTFALMQSQHVATNDGGMSYGLGISLFPFGDVAFVGHHGGVPGFAADNEMLPAQKFAVVVLGNAFGFATSAVNGPIPATLFPELTAKAVTAQLTPAAGEEVPLTARFRTFFEALQHGSVERTTVTDAMNAQLTPERLPALGAQFAALGTLERLVFRGKVEQPVASVYHYTGVFSNGNVPLMFALDKSGKIAGMFRE
jgi:D-alanyl-D-alanine carboxypeptidase